MLIFTMVSAQNSIIPSVTLLLGDDTSAIPANNITPNAEGDLTDRKLTNRDPDCAAYTGTYFSNIEDVQQNAEYQSHLLISADNTKCTLSSNNIPNHNTGANTTTQRDFSSLVTPNALSFVVTISRAPIKTDTASYVRKRGGYLTMNGMMLNGVDLDMDSAFCYKDSAITLGGCGLFADWYLIPAANPTNVTLDEYSGHPFSGRYHYHGDNISLSNIVEGGDSNPSTTIVDPSGSPVIGFAPDGFPIYGHYFYDAQTNILRKAKSSWVTLSSERTTPAGSTEAFPPIGTYPRGLFVEDWYYSANSGDLDECNGMIDAYGNYGYYYTESYPYGPLCSFGTPDTSFEQIGAAYDDGGANP